MAVPMKEAKAMRVVEIIRQKSNNAVHVGRNNHRALRGMRLFGAMRCAYCTLHG
jgi:hypothetical protein